MVPLRVWFQTLLPDGDIPLTDVGFNMSTKCLCIGQWPNTLFSFVYLFLILSFLPFPGLDSVLHELYLVRGFPEADIIRANSHACLF